MAQSRANSAEPEPESSSIHAEEVRYTAAEEAALLEESAQIRKDANKLFSGGDSSSALTTYERSLSLVPSYCFYDIAVLKSNIAACHLKLEDWKACVESCNKALNVLDNVWSDPRRQKKKKSSQETNDQSSVDTTHLDKDKVVEIQDGEDEDAEIAQMQIADETREKVSVLRMKCLLRRAKASTQIGDWSSLAGAEEDYKDLQKFSPLSDRDKRFVNSELKSLPPKISAARDRDVGEMMSKLKELGNGILKPFGLSTDMFNMQKDEKTGGYSMSFGGGGSSKDGPKS